MRPEAADSVPCLGRLWNVFCGCWVLRPSCTEQWDWMLCSTVGWHSEFALLPRWDWRICSTAGTALWLMRHSRQSYQLNSLARQGHLFGPPDGQNHRLGFLLRCCHKKECGLLRSECRALQTPAPYLCLPNAQWWSLTDSFSDTCEVRPEWASLVASCNSGETECLLGYSFYHWRNWRPRGALLVWQSPGLGSG